MGNISSELKYKGIRKDLKNYILHFDITEHFWNIIGILESLDILPEGYDNKFQEVDFTVNRIVKFLEKDEYKMTITLAYVEDDDVVVHLKKTIDAPKDEVDYVLWTFAKRDVPFKTEKRTNGNRRSIIHN